MNANPSMQATRRSSPGEAPNLSYPSGSQLRHPRAIIGFAQPSNKGIPTPTARAVPSKAKDRDRSLAEEEFASSPRGKENRSGRKEESTIKIPAVPSSASARIAPTK